MSWKPERTAILTTTTVSPDLVVASEGFRISMVRSCRLVQLDVVGRSTICFMVLVNGTGFRCADPWRSVGVRTEMLET